MVQMISSPFTTYANDFTQMIERLPHIFSVYADSLFEDFVCEVINDPQLKVKLLISFAKFKMDLQTSTSLKKLQELRNKIAHGKYISKEALVKGFLHLKTCENSFHKLFVHNLEWKKPVNKKSLKEISRNWQEILEKVGVDVSSITLEDKNFIFTSNNNNNNSNLTKTSKKIADKNSDDNNSDKKKEEKKSFPIERNEEKEKRNQKQNNVANDKKCFDNSNKIPMENKEQKEEGETIRFFKQKYGAAIKNIPFTILDGKYTGKPAKIIGFNGTNAWILLLVSSSDDVAKIALSLQRKIRFSTAIQSN